MDSPLTTPRVLMYNVPPLCATGHIGNTKPVTWVTP